MDKEKIKVSDKKVTLIAYDNNCQACKVLKLGIEIVDTTDLCLFKEEHFNKYTDMVLSNFISSKGLLN